MPGVYYYPDKHKIKTKCEKKAEHFCVSALFSGNKLRETYDRTSC